MEKTPDCPQKKEINDLFLRAQLMYEYLAQEVASIRLEFEACKDVQLDEFLKIHVRSTRLLANLVKIHLNWELSQLEVPPK